MDISDSPHEESASTSCCRSAAESLQQSFNCNDNIGPNVEQFSVASETSWSSRLPADLLKNTTLNTKGDLQQLQEKQVNTVPSSYLRVL